MKRKNLVKAQSVRCEGELNPTGLKKLSVKTEGCQIECRGPECEGEPNLAGSERFSVGAQDARCEGKRNLVDSQELSAKVKDCQWSVAGLVLGKPCYQKSDMGQD